jgi:hypothetical protein
MLKQKVAFQPQELASDLPSAASRDFRHRNLAVVVADSSRHAVEELEGPLVSLLERLGTLPGKHLAEDRVRVGQGHHEHRDLDLFAAEFDLGLSEVSLGFARPVRQRHKDLGLPLLPRPHCVLDDRQAAIIVMLIPKTRKDAMGRVPLLFRGLLILLEDLVYDRQEPLQLRLLPGLLELIPNWFLVPQNPRERPPR